MVSYILKGKAMLKQAMIITLIATPVAAKQKVNNAYVEDHYSTYYERSPEMERVCNTVRVPIYGTQKRSPTAGEILGGAIIGGLIGGTASGKDEGAAVGALLGGVIANESGSKRDVIVGHREVDKCDFVKSNKIIEHTKYDYSTITFTVDGVTHTVTFNK